MEKQRTGPVVVGVLDSQAALCAAEWAVDEAIDRGAALRLVHAVDAAHIGDPDVKLRFAADVLLSASAAINARGRRVDLDIAIINGSPTTVLTRESASAGMLCIGMDGRLRNGANGIGSTALALARNARCTVAIIRGGPPRSALTADRIAVSVNGSIHSAAAVEVAFREAHLRRMPLLVVATGAGAEVVPALMAPWQRRHPEVRPVTVSAESSLFQYLAVQPTQIRMVIIGADEVDQVTTAIDSRLPLTGVRAECCIVVARADQLG